ncbi:MAG TPA: hypothetical protein PK103_05610 [Elusimicrobiales bacterium]|nr:hypothetical protein [Elusimicrobiales bacterium]HPO94797.1 hypothetical protein [Elusimicrobiales bacterium]
MNKIFILNFIFLLNLQAEYENLGIFIPKRLNYVLGQDGSTPIEVKFGNKERKILWTYGDTLLGKFKGPVVTTATLDFTSLSDITSMPPNTLSMTDLIDEKNLKELDVDFLKDSNQTPSQFINYEEYENPFIKRLWANDGIQIKNTLYVYYMDIEIDSKTAGNFFIKGTGLVKAEVPSKPDINSFNFKRTGFYAEATIIGDSAIIKGKYLFLLGRFSKTKNNIYSSMCIGRVKTKDIENIKKYEFLSNSGKWIKEPNEIIENVNGESSIVYDEYEKKFRITYLDSSLKLKRSDASKIEDFALNLNTREVKDLGGEGKLYYSAKEIFYTKKHSYIIYMDPGIYQPIILKVMKNY